MKIREVDGYGRPICEWNFGPSPEPAGVGLDVSYHLKAHFVAAHLGLHLPSVLPNFFGGNLLLSYIVVLPGRRSTIRTSDFLVDLHSLFVAWKLCLTFSSN